MNSSGNGDGGPEGGLPDLPPDWGQVIIPDDAAELAPEAAAVRRELRRRARAARWRRRLGRPPLPSRAGLPGPSRRRSPDRSALRGATRLPLILLLIAVLATLTSLFAIVRATPARQTGRTASPPAGTDAGGTGGASPAGTLPALDLVGEHGELISLRSLLPALILLVDGCDCASRLDAAALAAPSEVTVVALASGRVPPGPVTGDAAAHGVRRLVDPAGELRSTLRLGPPDGLPTAVLVGRSARIVRTVPGSSDPARDYAADLPALVNS